MDIPEDVLKTGGRELSDYPLIEIGETLLERKALGIWQEREKRFPSRVRRMWPDVMDRATGAWGRCIREAVEAATPNQTGEVDRT